MHTTPYLYVKLASQRLTHYSRVRPSTAGIWFTRHALTMWIMLCVCARDGVMTVNVCSCLVLREICGLDVGQNKVWYSESTNISFPWQFIVWVVYGIILCIYAYGIMFVYWIKLTGRMVGCHDLQVLGRWWCTYNIARCYCTYKWAFFHQFF